MSAPNVIAEQMLTVYVTAMPKGYSAGRVRGLQAFSMWSAQEAARRLAEKLFPEAVHGVFEVTEGNVYTTRWQIVLKGEKAKAALLAHGWSA